MKRAPRVMTLVEQQAEAWSFETVRSPPRPGLGGGVNAEGLAWWLDRGDAVAELDVLVRVHGDKRRFWSRATPTPAITA